MTSLIILGIGSNLGNRLQNLSDSCKQLTKHLSDINISPVYESDAMMLPDSPPKWNIPFLNIVVSGTYTGTPSELLQTTQSVETAMGRESEHEKWSPRLIDIDILTFGQQIINTSNLNIPHHGTLERPFFLLPLADIHPDWKFPQEGANYNKQAAELASALTDISFNTTRTDYHVDLT